ncbi:MAG: SH3 domain-containing protein [Bacteroidetes bacterium]|nr:SH3 domain-containing protein [Bacteroidota bacterium]MBU1718671.1 SH3 domain-containing protein [Bacteroidota bacterium]
MKIRAILFVVILLTLPCVQAQEAFKPFKSGTYQYLVADEVNIRDKPSADGAKVAVLPIADSVKILEKTDEVFTLRGYETNWYKIEFLDNGTSKTGYVWGGMLARSVAFDSDGLIFLCGIYGMGEEEWHPYKMQIRVANKNKQVDMITFEIYRDFGGIEFRLQEDPGIKGAENIVSFFYYADHCAGTSGNNHYIFDGKKLHVGFELRTGFDAPVYHHEALIWPSNEMGVPNRVIWIMASGDYDADNPEKAAVKLYKWDGSKMVEAK